MLRAPHQAWPGLSDPGVRLQLQLLRARHQARDAALQLLVALLPRPRLLKRALAASGRGASAAPGIEGGAQPLVAGCNVAAGQRAQLLPILQGGSRALSTAIDHSRRISRFGHCEEPGALLVALLHSAA